MKKVLSLVLASLLVLVLLASCGGETPSSSAPVAQTSSGSTGTSDSTPADTGEPEGVVDGKFTETRHITVEMYEREGSPPPNDDSPYIQYLKKGMLENYNVEVEYQHVPRFEESNVLPQWIAANEVPDVALTYNKGAVDDFALQGGVLDLVPLLEEYAPYVQDLMNLLGDDMVYYDLDPNTGALYTIETEKFNDAHQKTYIREDWLAALDMDEPSTLEEFEAYLYAVKENAATLPGAPGANVIPYMVTSDVGWSILELAESVIPADMTDKEQYIWGWDSRLVMYPNYKEAVRIANKWYNEGLLWNDFGLYPTSDTQTPNDLTVSGYVGAFTQNVDMPYRQDYGIQTSLQANPATPDAAYIAVPTFPNANGDYYKIWNAPTDRKIFFPATNDEPLASLMYINFISQYDTLFYLMCGEEGVRHSVNPDGSITMIDPPEGNPFIPSSSYNIDMTMTVNNSGPFLEDPELTRISMSAGFPGIDPKYIERMLNLDAYTITVKKNASAGIIAAEGEFGTALEEKRNSFLAQSVVAPVDQFDAVYDAGYADLLATGGQAIIDERTSAWEAVHGDKDTI